MRLQVPSLAWIKTKNNKYRIQSCLGQSDHVNTWKVVSPKNGLSYTCKLFCDKQKLNYISILNNIVHKNIVPIKEFGLLPVAKNTAVISEGEWCASEKQGNCPFIITPYYKQNLAHYIENPPENLETLHRIILQICLALQKIHSYKVYGANKKLEHFFHGSLKPENIFISPKNLQIHIADTGLGSNKDLLYLSPEQRQNENIDHRTDLYALGKIFALLAPENKDLKDIFKQMTQKLPQRIARVGAVIVLINKWKQKEAAKRQAGNFLQLGKNLYEQGHYDYALLDFDRAVKMHPNLVEAYLYQGHVYQQLNDLEKSLERYSKAIEIYDKYALAYSYRADLYSELQQSQNAIRDYQKAVELDPEDGSAYGGLAFSYFAIKDYQKALLYFDKLIELHPDLAQAYQDRAEVYKAIDESAKAISDYQKAIELGAPESSLREKIQELNSEKN